MDSYDTEPQFNVTDVQLNWPSLVPASATNVQSDKELVGEKFDFDFGSSASDLSAIAYFVVPATRPLPTQHPVSVRILICAAYKFQCFDSYYGHLHTQHRSGAQATECSTSNFMHSDS